MANKKQRLNEGFKNFLLTELLEDFKTLFKEDATEIILIGGKKDIWRLPLND